MRACAFFYGGLAGGSPPVQRISCPPCPDGQDLLQEKGAALRGLPLAGAGDGKTKLIINNSLLIINRSVSIFEPRQEY